MRSFFFFLPPKKTYNLEQDTTERKTTSLRGSSIDVNHDDTNLFLTTHFSGWEKSSSWDDQQHLVSKKNRRGPLQPALPHRLLVTF